MWRHTCALHLKVDFCSWSYNWTVYNMMTFIAREDDWRQNWPSVWVWQCPGLDCWPGQAVFLMAADTDTDTATVVTMVKVCTEVHRKWTHGEKIHKTRNTFMMLLYTVILFWQPVQKGFSVTSVTTSLSSIVAWPLICRRKLLKIFLKLQALN